MTTDDGLTFEVLYDLGSKPFAPKIMLRQRYSPNEEWEWLPSVYLDTEAGKSEALQHAGALMGNRHIQVVRISQ